MKALKWILLGAAMFCLLGGNASATYIDFRDPAFQPALPGEANSLTRSVEGINLTIAALPSGPPAAPLYWDSTDGFGVKYCGSYEADEIEGPDEFLRVSFAGPVHLSEFYVTDLFADDHHDGYTESGWYSINGDPKVSFLADPSQSPGTNGERAVLVGANVNYILFSAPGKINGEDHDYSLGGVNVNSVPEPATLLLFGTGLVGLGLVRKKRSKKR